MRTAAFLLIAVCTLHAEIAETTLNLVAPGTDNRMDISFSSSGLSDTDSTDLSGTIAIRIEADATTGSVSSLEFTGGILSGTPIALSDSNFFASMNVTSTTLGGTLDTPTPPAPVSDGQSPAELHSFVINSGTISGTADTIITDPTAINQNLATDPVEGSGQAGDFVTLTLTPNAGASTASETVFDVEISSPVDIEQTSEITAGVNATTTVTGTIRATGQIAFPKANPYLAWTIANNIEGALFADDENHDGVPNGLAWALGYTASDRLVILSVNSDQSFTIHYGPEGPAGDVTAEVATDLTLPQSWTEATNPVVGPSTATYPRPSAATTAFFRVVATEPE